MMHAPLLYTVVGLTVIATGAVLYPGEPDTQDTAASYEVVYLSQNNQPQAAVKTAAAPEQVASNTDWLEKPELVEEDSAEPVFEDAAVIVEDRRAIAELTETGGTHRYLEVTNSCGPYWGGACVRVRSGPGTNYPVVGSVRQGMVLKVGETVVGEEHTWHEVVFDEWLRYPERLKSEWYIVDDFVRVFTDIGPQELPPNFNAASVTKEIIVDRSDQKLYAFDGDELEITLDVSTGLDISPTPRGVFTIFKKTPTRYMQGPLPYLANSEYYDLPGVSWNLYFTEQGAVIHGAYWHDSFGSQFSHGCVNVTPSIAEKIYKWADIGTRVIVRD